MKTPIEEYLESKTAAFGPGTGKKVLDMAGNAAMMAGVGAGVSAGAAGLGMAASKIYDAITKKHDFNLMLEHNSDLHEHFQRDPKFFNQAYSSLRAANPAFGRDPLVAGNYMRHMMDAPEGAGGKIEAAMAGVQRGASPMMDAFGKGALEGAKGGLKPMGGGRPRPSPED